MRFVNGIKITVFYDHQFLIPFFHTKIKRVATKEYGFVLEIFWLAEPNFIQFDVQSFS